ncbi:hypothetical protein DL769_000937 [Monosporascus sp. CRB-8-3]|nr:hypothetical protein DL769_000937 [Monosporascus sp. CRB-8-3]
MDESGNTGDGSLTKSAEEAGMVTAIGTISESPPKSKKPLSFYVSVFGLGLVALITSWDATSLAIALPAITSQLHGTTLESFWASISFTLGIAITQPIYDIILADITSLKERPMYLGLLAIAMALGTVSGPIVGALLSDFVDWRWIGWINLPIVGVSFLAFVFFLRLRAIPMSFMAKLHRLDWFGMLLFAVGATAMALPLSWADALYPWSSWRTLVPFVVGLVILVIFGFYERKIPVEPALPFRIFSNITSISSLITGFVHGMIMYTLLQYLPLFFQAVFLEPPLEAALSSLPVCCLTVAFSFVAPVIIQLTRRYRLLLWLGWVILTVFLGLWCLVGQTTSRAEAYAFQSMLGVGIGTVFTGAQVPMQASVAHVDDTGLAVGTLIVIRLFGALVGLSIGSTVFNSVFQKSIAALGTLPEPVRALGDASQAINFIPVLRTLDLPSEFMTSLIEAYQVPFRAIWIVMTCLSGVGLFVSLLIKELTLEKEDVGRQGFEQSS